MKPTLTPSAILAVLVAAALPAGGCTQDAAPPAKQDPTSGDADTTASIEPVLVAYEQIRLKLANDEIAAATEAAKDLEDKATAAASTAPDPIRRHLTSLATHATRLAEMPPTDADAVRKSFGEISRSTVAILAAEPSLRQGLYVFECPMAQGYQKWVQPTEAVANPYMGQEMLACGSASKWGG